MDFSRLVLLLLKISATCIKHRYEANLIPCSFYLKLNPNFFPETFFLETRMCTHTNLTYTSIEPLSELKNVHTLVHGFVKAYLYSILKVWLYILVVLIYMKLLKLRFSHASRARFESWRLYHEAYLVLSCPDLSALHISTTNVTMIVKVLVGFMKPHAPLGS